MNEVTVKLGSETSGLDSGLQRAQGKIKSFATTAKRDLSSVNQGGGDIGSFAKDNGRFIGKASRQASRAAISIDKGGDPFSALANSGSRVAAMMGPAGGIVAGGLLIGSVFHRIAAEGIASFDKLIAGAHELNAATDELFETGGVHEFVGGFKKLVEEQDALIAGRKEMNSLWGGVKTSLGLFIGGDTYAEKKDKLDNAQNADYSRQQHIQRALLTTSEQDIQIQKLKSKGLTEEAEKLERQFKLHKDIAQITNAHLPRDVQTKLIADLNTINKLRDIKAPPKRDDSKKAEERVQANEKLIGLQRRLNAERDEDLQGAEKLSALEELQQQRRNNATENGYNLDKPASVTTSAQTRANAGDFKGAEAALEALSAYQKTNKELDKETAQVRDKGAVTAKERAEKAAKVQLAKAEYDIELQLVDAKAASLDGDQSEVNALEDLLSLLKEQKRLKDQLGLDDDAALTAANALVTAQRNLKTAEDARTNRDRGTDDAINHARANGQTYKADQMEREKSIEKRADEVQKTHPGFSRETAREWAEESQKDKDRIAGKPIITRGYTGPSGIGQGGGLEAFYKRTGIKDPHAKPGLMGPPAPNAAALAVARNAQAAAAKAAADPSHATFQSILTEIQGLRKQLHFAN